MDSFFKMVDVQTVLFIYMAVGFFCRKKGIFNDAARDKLTDFVVLITLPCMIFESFHMELSLESLKQGGVAVLIATAMAGIALLLGKVLYNRFPYQEKSILQYGTLVTNSGFAGLPVVSGAYGDEVLDLSAASHGNALGVGLANVITKRFFDKIDTEKMYPNCLTSTVLTSARIPCVVANDREAIQMCIRTCTGIDRSRARIIRIPNSLHIGRIMLSEAYYRDVKAGKWPGVAACSEPEPLEFDGDGALLTPIEG